MDLIIYNGTIYTMVNNRPMVSAVAIKNGLIEKIGNDEEILSLKQKGTKLIDLHNKVLLPGFNDSHMHFLGFGQSLQFINLDSAHSIDELIELTKDFIKTKEIPSGKWIRGMRWNHNHFPDKKLPSRFDLDKISTEHPIVLSRVCGHLIVTNTKALEVIGITKDTPQPKGGFFDTDIEGHPLGIFRENAIQLIYDHLPEPTLLDLKESILLSANELLRCGITSVQSDDFIILPNDFHRIIKAFQELKNEDKLPIRVYEQCNFKDVESFKSFLESGYHTGVGDEYFKIGPLKLLADGSLGARTAYLSEAYHDDSSTSGIPVFSQSELDEFIFTAHEANMHVAVHAIGDKTMYMIFESIEKAQKEIPKQDIRHAIIHCQITDQILLDKYKELDVLAHIQPLFVSTDLHIVEERVGKERAKYTYNWKGLIDRGVKVACGSDCPVESPNVFYGLYAAVTRKDLSGFPEGGWLPEQKLSVEEAVYCYTLGSAYASFEENIKGSISPGKLADMVVISDNIFEIEIDKIKDLNVLMTFVNGELVYQS